MKINHISKMRNTAYGLRKWSMEVTDPDNVMGAWLTDTFPELEVNSQYCKGDANFWVKTWSGKQYFNKTKHQFCICGDEVMSMLQLKWQ